MEQQKDADFWKEQYLQLEELVEMELAEKEAELRRLERELEIKGEEISSLKTQLALKKERERKADDLEEFQGTETKTEESLVDVDPNSRSTEVGEVCKVRARDGNSEPTSSANRKKNGKAKRKKRKAGRKVQDLTKSEENVLEGGIQENVPQQVSGADVSSEPILTDPDKLSQPDVDSFKALEAEYLRLLPALNKLHAFIWRHRTAEK